MQPETIKLELSDTARDADGMCISAQAATTYDLSTEPTITGTARLDAELDEEVTVIEPDSTANVVGGIDGERYFSGAGTGLEGCRWRRSLLREVDITTESRHE